MNELINLTSQWMTEHIADYIFLDKVTGEYTLNINFIRDLKKELRCTLTEQQ